jgi:hypothetical protein
MTKSLVAIATATLAAATLLSSGAEAGFRIGVGFGGGVPPYLTDYNKQAASEHKAKKRYRAVRREESAPVRAAKKKSATGTSVAKADKVEKIETAPVKTAETENSSISLEQVDVAEKAPLEPVKTAAAAPTTRQIDCKKFFPSAGLTLTVPCE